MAGNDERGNPPTDEPRSFCDMVSISVADVVQINPAGEMQQGWIFTQNRALFIPQHATLLFTCSTVAHEESWAVSASYYNTAQQRATKLLRANLTELQLEQMANTRCFDVRGGMTGERYVVCANGEVNLIDDDQVPGGFCVHAIGVPPADKALAMLLMLQHDELGFLAVANYFGRGNSAAYQRAVAACTVKELQKRRHTEY